MGSSIRFKTSGDFKHLNGFFKKYKEGQFYKSLNHYGQMGVDALSAATPKDTGTTAASWSYSIESSRDTNGALNSVSISWHNSNTTKEGIPIVILLQYGHALPQGGYVRGQDFINPAIQPIFDQIKESVWKEVTNG